MLEDFIHHIRSKKLLDNQKRYLLAISGGVDSVALGHLLFHAGISFDVATVNFNLRGEASKGDYDLVSALAHQWQARFFGKIVTPEIWEESSHESIQMKARSIRYEWLEELRMAHAYEAVLVAHHMEDQLETIMLNLLRVTGVEGVFGMADVRGTVIRPLLPFRKKDLISFMKSKGYLWREDQSNQKDTYKRNFIRNQVLPRIEEGFPEGMHLMLESFARIKDTGKAFFHLFDAWKHMHVQRSGQFEFIEIDALNNLPGKQSMVYYWLRDYNFTSPIVDQIMRAVDENNTGKLFHSATHTVNLDRNRLLVGKRMGNFQAVELLESDVEMRLPGVVYDVLKIAKGEFLDKSSVNAMIDASKLVFPLTVRKWEQGDKFVPLGMKKEKKISDFLIDLKVPLIDKDNVWLMLSNQTIIWVIGYRISEQVKCDDQTTHVYYFKKNPYD